MDEEANYGKTSFSHKNILYVFFALAFLIFVLVFFGKGIFNLKNNISHVCGDGTLNDECSLVKPYGCAEGKLLEFPEICGCPEIFILDDGSCISDYQINPKEIHLKYVLRGEENYLDFVVYEGVKDYLSEISRSIISSDGKDVSRLDFKLKNIDEETQREFLLPLVIEIQNLTKDKEDQMRIAVSIVQNIPFGDSNKTISFGSTEIDYSRYPYEVLYDMEGVCGEKTELLAFLLRELDYGVGFFYFAEENHEALGIKCPFWRSLGWRGYCFIETSGPAIISDNKLEYVDLGELKSRPEIYKISKGKSVGYFLYEYFDANKYQKIRNFLKRNGEMSSSKKIKFENLKEKYGLAEIYYSD